jgi:uncharacterized membrane protein
MVDYSERLGCFHMEFTWCAVIIASIRVSFPFSLLLLAGISSGAGVEFTLPILRSLLVTMVFGHYITCRCENILLFAVGNLAALGGGIVQ